MSFPLSDEEHQSIESRIQNLPEIIVSAAILYDGAIISFERPGRHGNCLNWFSRNTHVARTLQHECGFLTSRGRFVGREEAGHIVLAMEQGSPGGNPTNNPRMCLYSEDMWNDEPNENAKAVEIDPAMIF